jgi:hypothetical protein
MFPTTYNPSAFKYKYISIPVPECYFLYYNVFMYSLCKTLDHKVPIPQAFRVLRRDWKYQRVNQNP